MYHQTLCALTCWKLLIKIKTKKLRINMLSKEECTWFFVIFFFLVCKKLTHKFTKYPLCLLLSFREIKMARTNIYQHSLRMTTFMYIFKHLNSCESILFRSLFHTRTAPIYTLYVNGQYGVSRYEHLRIIEPN